jgi:cob(I)alamin adenosyltransferase
MNVYIGQFMKGQPYGELAYLNTIPEITVEQYGDATCISRNDVTQTHIDMAKNGLKKACIALQSKYYDLVILDEINVAVWFGLITSDDVLRCLKHRLDTIEVVLTGRHAPEALIDYADLVTEMKEVKHYYHHGVQARDGIER